MRSPRQPAFKIPTNRNIFEETQPLSEAIFTPLKSRYNEDSQTSSVLPKPVSPAPVFASQPMDGRQIDRSEISSSKISRGNTERDDLFLGNEEDSDEIIRKLERELNGLKQIKTCKDTELRHLSSMIGNGGSDQNNPTARFNSLQRAAEAQAKEMRDLNLEISLLQEETERQNKELKRNHLYSAELMERPRNRTDLARQNEVFRQKIHEAGKDAEKRLFDEKLRIEYQSRAKMQKIAVSIGQQYVDPNNPEVHEVLSQIRSLERVNEQLENQIAINESQLN
jgi:hypothetical protein